MANRFKVNFTPRAKDDLREIWSYTFKVWSENQADQYIIKLFERFTWLSKHPSAGKHRPDICENYYCFPQGSHIIFYLTCKNCIDIIGVLHKEMDIANYFDNE